MRKKITALLRDTKISCPDDEKKYSPSKIKIKLFVTS